MAKWNHSRELRKSESKNDFRDQLKNAAHVILVQTQDKYLAGLNSRLGITPIPSIPIEQEQIDRQMAWIESHNNKPYELVVMADRETPLFKWFEFMETRNSTYRKTPLNNQP